MFKFIPSATITSVAGFMAGAVNAGMKTNGELDLGILYSELPCTAAGVFTSNQIKSAPVILSRRHLAMNRAQAIVVNSGCANACVGQQGLADALEMASLTASKLGISAEEVLVASTGVIGVPLPMDRIRAGIRKMELSRRDGHSLAKAMMTTDTKSKETAVHVGDGGAGFSIAGIAKGSGMIHPNLATMLCFIATDASVDALFLHSALKQAADLSFNMISIDGDTSPSDSVFLLANGLAANPPIHSGNGAAFQEALNQVCIQLAKSIAQDGEGATKLIEVSVEGAFKQAEACLAARTIASSPLVKTAIHGSDPNWGRIVAAIGRSRAKVIEDRLDVYLNGTCVMKQGVPALFSKDKMIVSLSSSDTVLIRVCLNSGKGKATAWGCDLSEEYVRINSEYTS
jgi:glutamate N-acetyltransferase / amino-acid N-acetyltransferase